jgi:hypothetical protein
MTSGDDDDMQRRWRAWQLRGVEGDRRRAALMGRVSTVIGIGIAIWLVVQLV